MSGTLTPLLAQYRRIKERYRDTLLLFRVGDFYEMFYEDAAIGAKALGLTLTSRPHGPHNRVPLAGIPVRAVDSYVARLVEQGFRVAVCDQLESPAPGKPVVDRDVVEVITPGTLTASDLLDARRNNFLCALSPAGDRWGCAFADVSTGEFFVAEFAGTELADELGRIGPRELLLPQETAPPPGLDPVAITHLDPYYFTQDYAFEALARHFGTASLDGFGVGELVEGICAAGAVFHYLEETQRAGLEHISRLAPWLPSGLMMIDRATRRNLELVERIHTDERKSGPEATLLGVLDRTVTPAGARLLRRWLTAPLTTLEAITRRHDAVEELLSGSTQRLRDNLSRTGDLERLASRIALERASPRELVAAAAALRMTPAIREALQEARAALLVDIRAGIVDFPELIADISSTIADDPPASASDGSVIRPGASAELDELRSLASGGREWIARLQESERQRTGIPNLRVRYNSVFGYYIEVTKSFLARIPADYVRRQTVAGAERFVTPELKEYETRVLGAEERARALELELFSALRRRCAKAAGSIAALARLLAELDVLTALAEVARERGYVRPRLDDSCRLEIIGGRHPVVEAMLTDDFIANDTNLDPDQTQIVLITGPNMAGKSTYLRQVALIAIMAQAGSFVPARQARIGIIDKVFTRIGASDDLARGVSTFLAEMTETANILNNATDRSLVILDEVGRGTAAADGLAIAWAVVEYLHGAITGGRTPRPKTLFATHYHELCTIATELPRIANYCFTVHEHGDRVVFLRRLRPGIADKSYGITVARLAGLPRPVVERARAVLATLGTDRRAPAVPPNPQSELPLPLAADRPSTHPVVERLRELRLEELTPLEALNLLAKLQAEVQQPDSDRR